MIEGIGGAAALANNQGIITEVFPANERGARAGHLRHLRRTRHHAGAPIGRLIVTYLSWNYIFLINVLPVGIVAFILALKLLPRGKKRQTSRSITGHRLLAAAVILFFFGLLTGLSKGYDKYYIILSFAGAVILVPFSCTLKKRSQQPIIDLSLFKNSLFTLSVICVLIQFFAMSGISIIQPFYIEDVLKIDPGSTGLIMMSFQS